MESISIVEDPQNYIGTYFVPPLARWELIEQAPINEMGNILNRAMQVLVEANTPSLGMLDIDFYNVPKNLNTGEGGDKIYSKHDEKTVYSSFQGQSGPGTS